MATNLTSKSKKSRLAPALLPLSDLDNGIVGWESQDDENMPLNFSDSRKWLLISLLSSITFISPLASSMFARKLILILICCLVLWEQRAWELTQEPL
jgi:hypothetical protein